MAKKAQGRPKKVEAPKAVEPIKHAEYDAPKIEAPEPITIEAQEDAPEIEAATEEKESKNPPGIDYSESKVVEAKTRKPKPEPKIRTKRTKRFPVIVKGKTRLMSKQSYEAVVKDPKLEVALPEGSELIEYVPKKGCKDC